MRHALILMISLVFAAGCSGESEPAAEPAADSITQRQRDSIIGESRLPGAQGVRGALEASDAAKSRAATIDSLSGGNR
jgi:hypothetical protein